MTTSARSPKSSAYDRPGPTPPIAWLRIAVGETIPRKALGIFFDVLATLVHAGTSQPDAIVQASHHVDPELRHICLTIAPQLRDGAALSDRLRRYSRRFPPIVVPILAVGDVSGTLEHSARRLADTFQGAASIERKMRTNVFNPWVAILVVFFARSYILIAQAKSTFSAIAVEALLTLAGLCAAYIGMRLLWRVLAMWQPLRMLVDTIAIALPNIGLTLRYLCAARWARSFATLWSAGIAVSSALEISARTASNAYYQRALEECAVKTRAGRSMAQSLKSTRLIPKVLLAVIETGEESGQISEGLESLAKVMEEEAYTRALQAMNGAVLAIQILATIVVAVAALSSLV